MEYSKSELRRTKIMDMIKKNGKISVQEITGVIGCSEATARRDLDLMEKEGQLIRTIGGAVYEGGSKINQDEVPFVDKQLAQQPDKQKIAEAAAALVVDGDVIGLTGGTTTFLIAMALKHHKNITVVTNAVNIAFELADAEGIQVVLTGGVMRSQSYELIGPLAESVIQKINLSKMFLGVDGVASERGFTMHSELEVRIAQQLSERSSEVYAVFDQSKLEKTALFTIMPLKEVTGIITNVHADSWLQQLCEKEHVQLQLV
ncbi:DeoR/GlpR family DNA-binding transcription regulator [Paenibacillus sp. KACC 21273]|uniref:DeoR/GlpR family DNA-binding transcription regulator n=1 Tax=Paenibacillus sp. KACC 21273 TaxID=3025665 RepID=UPI0023661AB6|nr:DeoR/GlpR family DNA-binding transcription regulator [Paenibacillus sp. KACC 21273]WDF53049.1 DeoR/GlpR family DNA-binding transcription regulator [Paenibacillus sp. KACC 21273]